MKTTTKHQAKQPAPPAGQPLYHPEFGKLGRDADLGIGILIAEDTDGTYEVLGPVATINEAIETAQFDYSNRVAAVGRGEEPWHVDVYKVWCRNYDGIYAIIFEIQEQSDLL